MVNRSAKSADQDSASQNSGQSPATVRYRRYRLIIDYVSQQDIFAIESVREYCHEEKPGFVTKVVNELVNDGWLIKSTDSQLTWNQSRGDFPVSRWLDDKIFGSQISASPQQDRPRERLLDVGAENLKTSELIAILVRSGRPGESAVTAGEKVAREFDGRVADLPLAGRAELKSISSAVEKTAFCQIMAGIELGRRVAEQSDSRKISSISGSDDAIRFCLDNFSRLISDARQEEFHIVTLNTKNQVIDTHQITVGTLDASLVHPREVFRAAIKDAASSIILVHNHPSGDPTPSREDHAVTDRLTETGKTIGIDVLDHIVLGKGRAVSIRSGA